MASTQSYIVGIGVAVIIVIIIVGTVTPNDLLK